KSSVLLAGGFQADLRLGSRESRGAALQYFTGSKAHNNAPPDRAPRKGLKINKYGLFPLEKEGRLARGTGGGGYRGAGPPVGAPRAPRRSRRNRRGPRSPLAAPRRTSRPPRRSPHAHDRDRRQR